MISSLSFVVNFSIPTEKSMFFIKFLKISSIVLFAAISTTFCMQHSNFTNPYKVIEGVDNIIPDTKEDFEKEILERRNKSQKKQPIEFFEILKYEYIEKKDLKTIKEFLKHENSDNHSFFKLEYNKHTAYVEYEPVAIKKCYRNKMIIYATIIFYNDKDPVLVYSKKG